MKSPGLFLSFEGIEGSGKSTQVRLLLGWLRERGREVLGVREPGGTALSEEVRRVLLQAEGPPPVPWAELCLYAAARAQLVRETIRPALERGAIIIADRYVEASVAYQGAGRNLGTARVRLLNRWVTDGLRPDRIFLLDLDPEAGLRRIRETRGGRALDRLESEPLLFHRRVRAAYLRMARRERDRFELLDASGSELALHQQIRRAVESLLAPASS